MNYFDRFTAAIKRTESWGLNSSVDVLDRSTKFLKDDSHIELDALFKTESKNINTDLLHECTNMSIFMLPHVQNHFGTDAFLTTGNLRNKEHFFFDCTPEYLNETLNNPLENSPKLKVHSWLTLISGEVIDFTFLRSHQIAFPNTISFKNSTLTQPLLHKFGYEFHPYIVGEDFYWKAGEIRQK